MMYIAHIKNTHLNESDIKYWSDEMFDNQKWNGW